MFKWRPLRLIRVLIWRFRHKGRQEQSQFAMNPSILSRKCSRYFLYQLWCEWLGGYNVVRWDASLAVVATPLAGSDPLSSNLSTSQTYKLLVLFHPFENIIDRVLCRRHDIQEITVTPCNFHFFHIISNKVKFIYENNLWHVLLHELIRINIKLSLIANNYNYPSHTLFQLLNILRHTNTYLPLFSCNILHFASHLHVYLIYI